MVETSDYVGVVRMEETINTVWNRPVIRGKLLLSDKDLTLVWWLMIQQDRDPKLPEPTAESHCNGITTQMCNSFSGTAKAGFCWKSVKLLDDSCWSSKMRGMPDVSHLAWPILITLHKIQIYQATTDVSRERVNNYIDIWIVEGAINRSFVITYYHLIDTLICFGAK